MSSDDPRPSDGAFELDFDELESRLARLHEDSFGWALSCCDWDHAEAEDVLQTTYLKIVSGRARFGGRSAFRTWLFGVIRLTALEHRRRARSRREAARRMAGEVAATLPAAAPVEAAVEHAELVGTLEEALALLPERQREVLHLVFYQDLTVRESAAVMGVSVGSARVHYDRAKRRLRALLAERETGGGDA